MSVLKVDQIQSRTGTVINAAQKIAYPGAVLQVVQTLTPGTADVAKSTILSTTSSSFSSIVYKTITTTVANSKILVTASTGAYNGAAERGSTRLVRDSTVLDADQYAAYDQGGVFVFHQFTVLDTPNVTAGTTLTYYYQGRSFTGATINFGYGDGAGGPGAQITLMEIAP